MNESPVEDLRQLDKHKPLHKELGAIAQRIERLIPAHPNTISNQELASTLDVLLGAIHALYLASETGYEERRRKPIELGVVRNRASQLKDCKVRSDGVWMAGFHLNSGLTRLAASYHRAC
jgi:hypothetical protein